LATKISSGDILNEEQLSESFKIYAGPGAGKTHFLVENIKSIILNNEKISSSQNKKVLCITYTNAAVDEIGSRLDKYIENIEIQTIHGFIIEYIIKPYQTELINVMKKDFDIEVSSEKKISSQIEGLGLLHGVDKSDIYNCVKSERGISCFEQDYSKASMSKIEVDVVEFTETGKKILYKPSKIDACFIKPIKKYVWEKVRKLTHNEILYFGYRMVLENSTIRYALRVKFPFVFVDEFQDTNPLQAKLIELLGEKNTIVGVIGDIAQSIYSFQGAKPSKFKEFSIKERTINDFVIEGNRRSTVNIVSMCNYIRQEGTLKQKSIKVYEDESRKIQTEALKVKFLYGCSENIYLRIDDYVQKGGVVLTRSWAAVFEYMTGIDSDQKKLLKGIYNSYYSSPIDIRAEISEHINVNWVRAFKFIFGLWDAYQSMSVSDISNSVSLYIDSKAIVDNRGLQVKLIISIRSLLSEVFEKNMDEQLTVNTIKKLETLLNTDEYKELSQILCNYSRNDKMNVNFELPCFNEYDKDKFVERVSKLTWKASYMLFNKVFSEDSQYMTVHQSKGLEWDKVIVSPKPSSFDGCKFIEVFLDPHILNENSQNEFTRLFFVGCSRAKEELIIHLENQEEEITVMKKVLSDYCKLNNAEVFYEFEKC